MESKAAAQQHLILASPSQMQRNPVKTNHSEPCVVDDEKSVSSIRGDSQTLTIPEGDIQKHEQEVNCQTAGHHTVGLGDDKHVPPSSDERNAFVRLIQDWWLIELLGLVLSVIAFAAIVIILRVFEGHALPDWRYHISLNTFLALFITIATAGLMIGISEGLSQQKWIWFMHIKRPLADFQKFDDASRGRHSKWIQIAMDAEGKTARNLASVGVLVSILSVAISPITQQIIAYPTRLVPIPAGQSAASVGRSISWDAWTIDPGYTADGWYDIDQATRLALLNGMWTAPNVTIFPVSPTCSTANCTFPVYNSLALCSSVANVTDYLTVKPTTYWANMTLPNGIWFEPNYVSLSIQTPATEEAFGDGESLIPNPINSTSLAFKNFSEVQASVVLNFFVLYAKALTIPGASINDSQLFAYRATEVLFHWCVNSYLTDVTAGNATTEIIASSSDVISPGDADTSEGDQNPPTPIVLGSKNDATEYTVNWNAADVLTFYLLANLGTGNFSQDPGAPAPQGAETSLGFTSEGAQVLSYALRPSGLGPVLTPADLADEDAANLQAIQNLTTNLATSLTNAMRTQPYSGDPVLGTAFISQSYVKVIWEWLIFLAVVEALSIIFLAATIITTKREKVAILKSSSLASMCALNEESRNYIGAFRSLGDVSDKALGLEVRLEEDGRDSWRLVSGDSSAY